MIMWDVRLKAHEEGAALQIAGCGMRVVQSVSTLQAVGLIPPCRDAKPPKTSGYGRVGSRVSGDGRDTDPLKNLLNGNVTRPSAPSSRRWPCCTPPVASLFGRQVHSRRGVDCPVPRMYSEHRKELLAPSQSAQLTSSASFQLVDGYLGTVTHALSGAVLTLQGVSFTVHSETCPSMIRLVDVTRVQTDLSPNPGAFMHIAAALQRPIISIWGNTIPDFGMYPYYGKDTKNQFICIENQTIDCRPCSKIGYENCPKGHFKCMEEIPNDKIIAQIKNSLNSTAKKSV